MPSRGIEAAAPSRVREQVAVAGVLVVVVALALLGRDTRVGASMFALPIACVLVTAFGLLTVWIMTGQLKWGSETRVVLLLCGFLWSGVIAIGAFLSMPGVLSPIGPSTVTTERVTLFYTARHVGVPLLLGLALVPWPARWAHREQLAHAKRSAVWAATITVGAASAFGLAVLTGADRFSGLVVVEDSLIAPRPGLMGTVLVVNLTMLALAVHGAVKRRLHRRLESWVVIALLADSGDTLLTTLTRQPFSVSWYGARVLAVVGAGVVVLALLHEARKLQVYTTRIAEQLAAQNAELTEAQGLREHLTAVVSHDMRSPLAGLMGYLEVLENDPTLSPFDVERMHQRSRLLTRRLIMLTEDLLASATSAGLLVLPEEIDLRAQIEETAAAFPELSIIVRCPTGVQVLADPLRLQQILTNLVRNAQKHGAAPVHVRASLQGSAEVRISVSDAGAGVPLDFVPQLFERYTRGPGRATHGSGLGLWVARSMAERHGGTLDYEVGTRAFVLVMPRPRQRLNVGALRARKALTPSLKSEPV